MKRLLFLLFLTTGLGTFSLNAQVLNGIVVEADGKDVLPGTIIANKTTGITTMTDGDGKFSLKANKTDQIEASGLGYFPVTLQMPDSGTVFRRIAMKKKLFTLDEVKIGIHNYTPYQLDSIKRRSIYNLALNRTRASSSVMGTIFSPASALAEQFSKKSKQLKRFQTNFPKWEDQKYIDTRYSPDAITELTGITGDTLAAFMHAYPMPVDYARTASDFEVKSWIKYNYKQWIKNPIVLPPSIPDNKTDSLKKP